MSLLDGLAGIGVGLAGAGSAFAAREEAERLDRELAIREAQEGRAAAQERERLDVNAANQNMIMVDDADLWNATKTRIDPAKAAAKLEAGDAASIAAMKNIARTSGLIDPSVKDIRFVKAPDGKGWVIQTSNEDGTFGVITADGSKDPNAPVAKFATLEDFVKSADVALGASRRIQTAYDIQGALAAEGIVDADLSELEASIANQPVEQQVAIRRGVVAGAANIEDPTERQQFIDSVASGEPPPEPEPKPEPKPEQIGRNQEMLRRIEERKMDSGLEEKRAQLKTEEARLENLEKSGRSKNAARGARNRVNRLKEEIAELEPATFTMDTPEQQASVDKVVEETKDMPTDQVVEKVMSGEVTMSPQDQAAVATQLQQAGVQTVNDLAKLENRRDRAMARVAMIAAIGGGKNPDLATRRDMLQQISNIFETGTASMTAKDATTLGLQRDVLEQRRAEYALDIERFNRTLRTDFAAGQKAAGEIGAKLQEDLAAVKENGVLTEQGVQQFLPSLAPFLTMASALTPEQRPVMMRALAPVFSEILATYAAREEGGVAETLISIFRGDADPSNISKTDFDLSRVEGKFTPDGKFEGFYYTGPPGRDKDGNRIPGRRKDELVLANDIRQLDKTLYDVLVLAALANAEDQPLSLQDVEDVAVPRVR
jgi:hypothetical protein